MEQRKSLGLKTQQQFHAPQSQQNAKHATDQREQNALRHQLTYQSPASRSQGAAHLHLLRARGHARQQQADESAARKQEHASRATQQQRRRRLRYTRRASARGTRENS